MVELLSNRTSGHGVFVSRGRIKAGWLGRNPRGAIGVNRPYLLSMLFGRTRIGVRFHVAPLLIHHPAQFPFHYLERIVYHLRQRLVRAVIDLFLFRDQFVAGRDRDINPHPELVSFFVSVIRLLNGNVAPADVIAKFVQPSRFLQHQLFDSLGFFQAAVSDVYWQLHSGFYSNAFGPQTPSVLMRVGLPPFPRLAARSENGKLTSPVPLSPDRISQLRQCDYEYRAQAIQ